jgi:hypothetical protein
MFVLKARDNHGSEAGFGKKRSVQPAVLHRLCDKHAWIFTPNKYGASRPLRAFFMLHDSNLWLFDTAIPMRISARKTARLRQFPPTFAACCRFAFSD